jgi:cytochrome c-type biogenesis protein CcsB
MSEQLSVTLFIGATIIYFLAVLGYFFYLAYKNEPIAVVATGVTILGLLLHAGSIGVRWVVAGHTPLTDMYEYSSLFAFMVVASYLVVQVSIKNKTIGGFALGIAFLLMGLARQFYKDPSPLVPALQSYWLEIHVFTMVISSGALGVAFLFAVLYYLKDRQVKRNGVESGLLAKLPSMNALDNLSYRTTAFGFPLWTIGIVAGAIWAEQAWGRYWGWDPKETWSFITWLIYAGYLHARITAGWRGRSAAILSAIGFASVIFTFFFVNLWVSGLHSYAA